MNDIQEGVIETAPVENTGEAVTGVVATPQDSVVTEEKTVQAEAHSEALKQEAPEDRFEKAFAARLAKERTKLESEIAKKYSKHDYVLKMAAAENDITVDEYLDSLESQYKEKELSAIPKEFRDDVLWARERRLNESQEDREKRIKEEETQRWLDETKSLLQAFPDIKSINDIPDEVMTWRVKDNVPLEYAYAKYALGKERTKIEQETLRKLKETEAAAVPSMASSSTDTKLKISAMDDADFEKLMEEVKQGKRKSL